jgi:hypothetical protein
MQCAQDIARALNIDAFVAGVFFPGKIEIGGKVDDAGDVRAVLTGDTRERLRQRGLIFDVRRQDRKICIARSAIKSHNAVIRAKRGGQRAAEIAAAAGYEHQGPISGHTAPPARQESPTALSSCCILHQ